jgi:hypothetical protein
MLLRVNRLTIASRITAPISDHDVEDDALLGIALHDDAGQPAYDAADDQPDDDAHDRTSGGKL